MIQSRLALASFIALVGFVLSLLSCTENITPPDSENLSDAVISAGDYCETIAEGFCDFYLRCGRMAVSTQEQCLNVFAEGCEARFEESYVALADAGLMELGARETEACLDHLSDVQCALQPRDFGGPCADMWRGLQGPDEACGFNLESLVCAPGNECVLGLDLCGSCRPLAAVGDACGPEATCGPFATCTDNVCTARVRLGEACTPEERCELGASCREGICAGPNYVGLGRACDNENRCPYKSHCDGVCVEDALLGEGCANTDCNSGRCVGNLCVPLASVGETCGFASDCTTSLCSDGRCANPPSACFED